MTFEKLVVLIPCPTLEDFPDHLGGRDAESLLAAWTALWHPALVADANAMPSWCPADEPPESVANVLFTISRGHERRLESGIGIPTAALRPSERFRFG